MPGRWHRSLSKPGGHCWGFLTCFRRALSNLSVFDLSLCLHQRFDYSSAADCCNTHLEKLSKEANGTAQDNAVHQYGTYFSFLGLGIAIVLESMAGPSGIPELSSQVGLSFNDGDSYRGHASACGVASRSRKSIGNGFHHNLCRHCLRGRKPWPTLTAL